MITYLDESLKGASIYLNGEKIGVVDAIDFSVVYATLINGESDVLYPYQMDEIIPLNSIEDND